MKADKITAVNFAEALNDCNKKKSGLVQNIYIPHSNMIKPKHNKQATNFIASNLKLHK